MVIGPCFSLTVSFYKYFFIITYLEPEPLHSPDCLGTHDIDQVGIELTEFKVPVSASLILGLKKGMHH